MDSYLYKAPRYLVENAFAKLKNYNVVVIIFGKLMQYYENIGLMRIFG